MSSACACRIEMLGACHILYYNIKSRRDMRSSDSQDFADSTQHSTVLKMHTTSNTIEKASSNNYSETTTYPVMLYLLHSYVVYCSCVFNLPSNRVVPRGHVIDMSTVQYSITNFISVLLVQTDCICIFFSHILNLE